VGAVLLATLALGGCAWRAADVEHYVGPVLFRFRPPGATAGAVSQVVRVGVSAEAGRQWGVAAGVVDRVAAVPASPATGSADAPVTAPRWRTPLSPFAPPRAGRWNLSLLYLRVEALPVPALVARRTWGAELTAGRELTAASVGWTSRTLVLPPEDACSVLRFDSRHPLDTVFLTWPEGTAPATAAWIPIKEAQP
jgi:hypothetical protein